MAKEIPFDYKNIRKELLDTGPAPLYFLWGDEDYLKEKFMIQIEDLIIPEGGKDFNEKIIEASKDLNLDEISAAIDAMPFMSDHTLVIIKDADLNNLHDNEVETLDKILKDIPEYCTVVFSQHTTFKPDGRKRAIKSIKKHGKEIHFYASSHDALISWIKLHFQAHKKEIDYETAEYLIFNSGDLMNQLLPEIDKLVAYTSNSRITKSDINIVATRIPEASVFLMTDYISNKKPDKAAEILYDLLGSKNSEPIAILAYIGSQMRSLYTIKLANERHLGNTYIESVTGMPGWKLKKLSQSANKFSLDNLKNAVIMCCEADYEMKSTGRDDGEILQELIMHIAAGGI